MTVEQVREKAERIRARLAQQGQQQAIEKLAAALNVSGAGGAAAWLAFASTATSGLGDQLGSPGNVFSMLEHRVREGARQGAALTNARHKALHARYQAMADDYWTRHPGATKRQVALWIEAQIPGARANTIRARIARPSARKLMSAG